MSLNTNVILLIIIGLFYISFLLITRIFLNKFLTLEEIFRRNNRRLVTILSLINSSFEGTLESLRAFKEMKQYLLIDRSEGFEYHQKIRKIAEREIKMLGSRSKVRRKEACTNLGIIGSERARLALEQALAKEKDVSVKIYLSNALTDIRHKGSLAVMIDALLNSNKWYRARAISNILEFESDVHPFFLSMRETRNYEWIELNISYAGRNLSEETKDYLFFFVDHFEQIKREVFSLYLQTDMYAKDGKRAQFLDTNMDGLLALACRTLSNYYYTDFGKENYWCSENPIVRQNAYWALSKGNSTTNFKILMSKLNEERYVKHIIAMLTKMIEMNPRFLYIIEDAFYVEKDEIIKSRMAQVLSNKIEYYILQLLTRNRHRSKAILSQIIQNKRINELIGFINLNTDLDLENILVELIGSQVAPESDVGLELRTYLKKPFLDKCGFTPLDKAKSERVHVRDEKLANAVLVMILISIFLIPILFVIRHWNILFVAGIMHLLTMYVIEFNYGLIFYSFALAGSTFILMLLSFFNVKDQARLWNYKNLTMLFRDRMLPSISIIAPAYNEEKSIVSSVKSLLNLKYPDYELIVVNDGSKDETLGRLIEAFHLIRVDYVYTTSLVTAPIRGIYRNASLPNLVVIDKSNGGKADSLNAGINVANKEYFCGIDSDSMLEPEALLRLASLTLDESVETPALGGNILPINGCKVDNGLVSEIHIPRNIIARLQTIEYLRAFMIGRLGWEQINSLLIISGAFGLFRKDRIIEIGGYLTSKGKYQKDTVGEDMELVVRIKRMMLETNLKSRALYAFNANCWTEVPEDLKSLKSQRYRWQRGLVDILYFHRKMLFNTEFGTTGLIAMPYFLIFETLGPLFEIQGYGLVILAGLMGILNVQIALMLFISAVLIGVINSLAALLIAEREEQYFSIGDLSRLVLLAIGENFGPRQWISLWRVLGQFNIIFGQSGWGKIQRKGI